MFFLIKETIRKIRYSVLFNPMHTFRRNQDCVFFREKMYFFPVGSAFSPVPRWLAIARCSFHCLLTGHLHLQQVGIKQEKWRRGSTNRSIFQIAMAGILIISLKPILSSMIDTPGTHKTKGFQQSFLKRYLKSSSVPPKLWVSQARKMQLLILIITKEYIFEGLSLFKSRGNISETSFLALKCLALKADTYWFGCCSSATELRYVQWFWLFSWSPLLNALLKWALLQLADILPALVTDPPLQWELCKPFFFFFTSKLKITNKGQRWVPAIH